MKLEINKKTIYFIIVVIFLLSALIYNILYINNEKNEIIEEINFEEENIVYDIEEVKTIYVDIGGEVISPGMYELPENSRVNDIINLAGGVTDKADLTTVNLAFILSDAMKIIIPKKEVKKVSTASVKKQTTPVVSTTITVNESNNSGLININTASKEDLMNLNGIGDATAQKIINYRNENGNFNSKEDIKNVSGIGESKYNSIKENITI